MNNNSTKCYYPSCTQELNSKNKTKEHIPPKSFFPNSNNENFRENLMTVKSCIVHNNGKSICDYYALKNIAFSIWIKFSNIELCNNNAFLKLIESNNKLLTDIKNTNKNDYLIDGKLLDKFFNSLTFGVIYKKLSSFINIDDYIVQHKYLDFCQNWFEECELTNPAELNIFIREIISSETVKNTLSFKLRGAEQTIRNEVYSVKIIGVDSLRQKRNKWKNDLCNHVTIVHDFYGGLCRVVTLLTKKPILTDKGLMFSTKID